MCWRLRNITSHIDIIFAKIFVDHIEFLRFILSVFLNMKRKSYHSNYAERQVFNVNLRRRKKNTIECIVEWTQNGSDLDIYQFNVDSHIFFYRSSPSRDYFFMFEYIFGIIDYYEIV